MPDPFSPASPFGAHLRLWRHFETVLFDTSLQINFGARFGCMKQARRNGDDVNVCTIEQFYVSALFSIAA
jgi:hypothetical protein